MASQQIGYAPALGDWIDVAPWKSPLLVLATTSPETGDTTWAGTVTGKRAVLTGPPWPRFVVWPGQYSTNVRAITPAEATALAERYFK